jgi:Aspartyl/Asparaginyl beta-hydroxylase
VKDWQHGIELALLKEHCAVFEAHDKGLSLSQFGSPNEAAVADWLSRGWVTVARRRDKSIGAVVVAQEVERRPVPLHDFREAVVATAVQGDVVVRRFAGDSDLLGGLLELAVRRRRGATYLECWQEKREDRVAMEGLGAQWVGTKIKASSEMRGLWRVPRALYGGVPWHERHSVVRLAARKLNVAPLARVLQQRKLQFADHYSTYNSNKTWSALALRGYGGAPNFIIKPSEMAKKWKAENPEKLAWTLQDTPLRAQLPEAEALLGAVPGRHHRVRLMRLAPGGGELKRHADITDPDAGVEFGRLLRIHIPVVTNPGVKFECWDLMGDRSQVHMAAGAAWYLDTRKPHTARNDGASERVHLVVDVESCAELLALLPRLAAA